ncbi:tRNA-specific adenosine deaminase [Acholeplasma oculi]|uniref:dCMP deaminase n=1 Tax=Acholeplasma oculi TaxID=35623 RepID=A0A061AAS4_9MOLU|nr:dCMP deaminase family protein [Acholeplasma oculi]CDR31000.1 dCMP deaminase [Acholeplasma oculi]SKC36157.1 dCMP deaminase [Acholeplasma oculi]SUT90429.1 tRNA-specific adenosine deaminase [Acholeplasma oculi]
MKRENYISWDQYFMGVAKLSALRSKDPSTQVGACIINEDKRIIAIGYNGLPKGLDDNTFNWSKDGKYSETKYPYVVHAEANAILNATTSLKNSTLYVTLFPCNECMKLIVQAGIKEIVFMSDKDRGKESHYASTQMMQKAMIQSRQIKLETITLESES